MPQSKRQPQKKQFGKPKFNKPPPVIISPEILPICSHALPVPISTRGIGFAVSYTHKFLGNLRHFDISIYQLYRATLLQFQLQMYKASELMYKHQIVPKEYNNMHMSVQNRKIVAKEEKNFKILTNIVAAFGPFTHENIPYQPYLPDRDMPNAFGVTFMNLRETVVALSTPDKDSREKRWLFYRHNSIPGAIWQVDETANNAVLTNPDIIMPPEYNLEKDYRQFSDSLRAISQLYSKYIDNIPYSGEGDKCQIVSILEQCTDGIPSTKKITRDNSTTYEHFSPPDTELKAYAYGVMTKEDMVRGIITLYGEHCKDTTNYDVWGCRSDLTGQVCFCVSWENCIFTSFNNLDHPYDSAISVPAECALGNFALPLPISTRGVGFAVSYMYNLLSEYITLHINAHQLFRASLLQLQYRMFKCSEARQNQLAIPKSYFNVFVNITDPRFIRPPKNNFKLIASIINKFGPFVHGHVEYHPGIPEIAIPDPFNVTIDNLRATVIALSNNAPDTRESRYHFYRHNSIPGAIWSVNEATRDATLTNPDEIMPGEYSSSDDLSALVRCMSDMEMKEPDYIGNLKFFGPGNACQLVSIIENCTDFIPNSKKSAEAGKTMYKHYSPACGGVTPYTRVRLNQQPTLMGVLGLYGEHCQHKKEYEIWGCRSPSTGCSSSPNILWTTVARYCVKLDM